MKLTKKLQQSLFIFALTAGMAAAQSSNQSGAQTSTPQAGAAGSATGATAGSPHGNMSGKMPDANASAAGQAMVGKQDMKFIMEAAEGGMMEVQAAQLAQQKASSQAVKDLAKTIEKDHTQANMELKTIAGNKNVMLPSTLGPKHQAHMAKLQAASAEQFDREYIKLMSEDHKKDISAFRKQETASMDSDVKAFAAKTLPTLQAHATQVEQLQGQTRSRKGSMSTDSTGSTSGSTSGSSTGTTSGSSTTNPQQ